MEEIKASVQKSLSDLSYEELSKITYLFIEPFYGGSHKQLIDLLAKELFSGESWLLTLPDKKWQWKMRASSLHFAQQIPTAHNIKVIFASSMLNLCEFMSLRPDLKGVKTVLYFHENQLNYPKRKVEEERDFHFGWVEVLSCLCATHVVFNSEYNMNSFLKEVPGLLSKVPTFGFNVQKVLEEIKMKSSVLYFPLKIPEMCMKNDNIKEIADESKTTVNILWNHRWEYDKDPDTFFDVIIKIAKRNQNLRVFVLGEAFEEQPAVFETAKTELEKLGVIGHWGYCESKEKYYEILNKCHIVISTAIHEFYGVAVIEAILCGCYPLCPNRLVYPEYLEKENLYNTPSELYKKLKNIVIYKRKESAEFEFKKKADLMQKVLWKSIKPFYQSLLRYRPKLKLE